MTEPTFRNLSYSEIIDIINNDNEIPTVSNTFAKNMSTMLDKSETQTNNFQESPHNTKEKY